MMHKATKKKTQYFKKVALNKYSGDKFDFNLKEARRDFRNKQAHILAKIDEYDFIQTDENMSILDFERR